MLSSGGTASHSLNYSDLDHILSQPETEHNWAAKENACKQIGNATYPGIQHDHDFVAFVKNHRASLSSAIKTERTRLSGTACDMVEKLAKAMQGDFGPLLGEVFTSPLLQVCARTNKVMVTRAVKALQSTIDAGSLVCLPKACAEIATPNKTLRIACIGLVARSIDRFSAHELEPLVTVFEPVLKEGVSDAAPEVRDTSRKTFKAYALKFPERAATLMATMPANVLKYLQPDAKSVSGTGPGSATGASAFSRTATGGITKSLPSGGVKASLASRHHSSRDMSLGGAGRIGGNIRPVPVRAASVPAATVANASGDHFGQGTSLRAFKTASSPNTTSHQSSLAHQHQHQQPQHHQHHPHASSDIPRTSLVERQSNVERTFRSYSSTTARHPIYEHAESSPSLSTTSTFSSSTVSTRPLANRSRTLSGNTMTASAMMQRLPAINLAAHGGAQRVAPPGSSSMSGQSSHSNGSSSLGSLNTTAYNSNRVTHKTEPSMSRANRMSISGSSSGASSGAAPKERVMSASERAKAYAASLKLEMSQRRANDVKAAALRGRRAATESAEDRPSPLTTMNMSQRSGRTIGSMSDTTHMMAHEPWQGARSASPQLESYPCSSFDTTLPDTDASSMDIHHDEPLQRQDHHPSQHQSEHRHPQQQQQQQKEEQAVVPKSPEMKLQDVSMTRELGPLSILTDTTKHGGAADGRHGPLSGSSSVPSSVTSGSSAGSSCSSPASLTWSVAGGILNQVTQDEKDHQQQHAVNGGAETDDEEARARFAKPSWPDVDMMIPEHTALFGSTETILRTEAEIAAFHRMQKELTVNSSATTAQHEPEELDAHEEAGLDGAMGAAEMEGASTETASVGVVMSTQESEHGEAHMMSDVEHDLGKPLEEDVEALLAMDEGVDQRQHFVAVNEVQQQQQQLHERSMDEMGQAAVVQASVD